MYDGSDLAPGSEELNHFLKVCDLDPESKNEVPQVNSPYAIGVMIVRPGKPVIKTNINTYHISYYPPSVFPFHLKRSTKLLDEFIPRIIAIIKQNKDIKCCYFHNLSRFDGIIILRNLALHHSD